MKSFTRFHLCLLFFLSFFFLNNNIYPQWEQPLTSPPDPLYFLDGDTTVTYSAWAVMGYLGFNDSTLLTFESWYYEYENEDGIFWEAGLNSYRTTDFGNSWNPGVFGFGKQLDYELGYQLINDSTWLVYINNHLSKTTDGINWQQLTTPPYFNTYQSPGQLLYMSQGMFFIDSNDGWFSGGSNEYRTTDGGITWAIIDSGYSFNSMYFVDENNGFGLDHSSLYKTTDAGHSWNNQDIGNIGNLKLFKVKFVDSNVGFITSQNGIVFKTTDGGNTWHKKLIGITISLSHISFINQNEGWIAGSNSAGDTSMVLLTTDSGETWTTIYHGFGIYDGVYNIYLTSPQYGYVYSLSGGVLRDHISEAVPVELVSFNGNYKQSENNVELNWSTATELSNNGFDIERKTNNNWIKIGFVKGSGNSTSNKSYLFNDNNISNLQSAAYRLKQIDFDGTYKYSKEIKVNINNLPTVFKLEQNYPNPFNPSTIIKYQIPFLETHRDASVQLKIYDILGNEVTTLVNETKAPGNYEIKFDGSKLASGVYFYKLSTSSFVKVKKMLLLK